MNWNEVVEFALTRKDVQINEDMIYVNDLKFFQHGAIYYCSDRNVWQTLVCKDRSLDQIKTVIESITDTAVLTDQMKADIKAQTEKWEIEVSELDSYAQSHNDQNFARFSEPDDEDWDEAEEWQAKKEKMIEALENDGLWEYTQMTDSEQLNDDNTHYLTDQAIKFVESL